MNRSKQPNVAGAKAVVDSSNPRSAPLNYSFQKILHLEELLEREPRTSSGEVPKNEADHELVKKDSDSLRLNNNNITEIGSLHVVLRNLLVNPASLAWLDLSFNHLEDISPVLSECDQLSTLYLHSNSITNLWQIERLSGLENLHRLTLHGNPVETVAKGYRSHVISTLPGLQHFDFSAVTKSDRATAASWSVIHKPKRRRKREESGGSSGSASKGASSDK